MLWVLFSVAIVIAVYFATRFFLLKAMKEANRGVSGYSERYTAESDPSHGDGIKSWKNMAHPSIRALEQIRTERQEYEKRERAFQSGD